MGRLSTVLLPRSRGIGLGDIWRLSSAITFHDVCDLSGKSCHEAPHRYLPAAPRAVSTLNPEELAKLRQRIGFSPAVSTEKGKKSGPNTEDAHHLSGKATCASNQACAKPGQSGENRPEISALRHLLGCSAVRTVQFEVLDVQY